MKDREETYFICPLLCWSFSPGPVIFMHLPSLKPVMDLNLTMSSLWLFAEQGLQEISEKEFIICIEGMNVQNPIKS
jgi:hypothetical protein